MFWKTISFRLDLNRTIQKILVTLHGPPASALLAHTIRSLPVSWFILFVLSTQLLLLTMGITV